MAEALLSPDNNVDAVIERWRQFGKVWQLARFVALFIGMYLAVLAM
jgi:hypothetical protein